jgi:hypothetical protein
MNVPFNKQQNKNAMKLSLLIFGYTAYIHKQQSLYMRTRDSKKSALSETFTSTKYLITVELQQLALLLVLYKNIYTAKSFWCFH